MWGRIVACLPLLICALAPVPATGGLAWRPLAFAGTPTGPLALAQEGRVIYLATTHGLHLSEDGGETWRYVGAHLERQAAPDVIALAVDARDPAVAYAGTERGRAGGLYVTRDAGLHWQRLFAGRREDGVRAVAASDERPPTLLAVAVAHDGVDDELVASADGGETWQVVLREAGTPLANKLYALYFAPRPLSGAFAVASQGVLVAGDASGRWTSALTRQDPVYALAFDPLEGRALYAIARRAVLHSADGGLTWREVTGPALGACHVYERGGLVAGPPTAPALFAVARSLCPDAPARLFALLPEAMGDVRWAEVGEGLPPVSTAQLAVAGGAAPRLYAATPDGLWVADLPADLARARATETGPTDAPREPSPAAEDGAGVAVDPLWLAVAASPLILWLVGSRIARAGRGPGR